MGGYVRARRVVFWCVVIAAALVAVMSVVETVTADPQQGEGWIGGPFERVLAGGPLVLVAIGLRSESERTARRTAIAAMIFAGVVGVVLVMQLLDANETVLNRLIQVGALVLYLAVCAVELPAFSGHAHRLR